MSTNFNSNEIEFMSSKASAFLLKTSTLEKLLLWIIFGVTIFFLFWANVTQIDELVQGQGKVIPSGKTQIIQNYEGGIIKEILVNEGSTVRYDDILIKLDNKQSFSSLEEAQTTYNELYVRSLRLKSEAQDKPFSIDLNNKGVPKVYLLNELELYQANQKQLKNRIDIYISQKKQRASELNEARYKISALKDSHALISQEIKIKEPLVKKGIEPETAFLKLKREASTLLGEYQSTEASLPRLANAIIEIENKINEERLNNQQNAQQEYTKVIAQLERTKSVQHSFQDQVTRTEVRSPVNGTIKQIFVNTIGGVIKPGMNLLEIVPTDETLLIEAKITPSDIAFIHPDQKATIRFTAYDYTIYGYIEGNVKHISADSMVNDKGESYYLIKLEAKTSYLEKDAQKHYIIPGMIANVDIVTGKKTVLDYIFKPILKAQKNAFHER
ncbi:HlyD family type I secretion periplasmic adaptor subunit [bacterium]|nr:HlyD family type I secretion periplasmic adaptor subunit [bacterium]MBU1994276.1 HlyD family type I secretion periplasmic adaptor subunit [bacterium]